MNNVLDRSIDNFVIERAIIAMSQASHRRINLGADPPPYCSINVLTSSHQSHTLFTK